MALRASTLLALLASVALLPLAESARRLRSEPFKRGSRGVKPWDNLRNATRPAKKAATRKAPAPAHGVQATKAVVAAAAKAPIGAQAKKVLKPVDAEGPVMTVEEREEIPVMHVVLVRDGQEDAPRFEDSGLFAERRQGPPAAQDGISGVCKKEMMAFQSSESKMMKAQACESKSNNTDRAMQALRRANVTAANLAAADTFQQCAGISKDCSQQVAPQIVLAMRMSGVAISQSCSETAQQPPKQSEDEAQACQKKATEAMFRQLAARDLQGCLVEAEHGLNSCQGIKPPCDFQLAPLLVANLLQAATAASAPQQVTEVLLTGLRVAEELAEELATEETAAMAAHENASHVANKAKAVHAAVSSKNSSAKVAPTKFTAKVAHPAKADSAKGKKAISLLSIAGRIRVVPARGPFRF